MEWNKRDRLGQLQTLCIAALLWTAAGSALAACTGGPELFVCLNRADYVAKLQSLTQDTFFEGFQNNGTWGAARTAGTVTRPVVNTQPSVISKGIIWTTNYPSTNGISTSAGAARSGGWGVYDPKHGAATGSTATCDVDAPPEPCLYYDGVTGTLLAGEPSLLGAGGYFRGLSGASIAVVLDDQTPIELAKVSGTGYRFMGVISASGFRKFQFREMEGKIGQALYIFADDFTFGAAPAGAVPVRRDLVGVRQGNRFKLDFNGNDQWNGIGGGDVAFGFGAKSDIPVIGDWDGDGVDEVGVWRPSKQWFMLDANANDRWDGPTGGDIRITFGAPGDVPVVGDWDGDGTDDIGVWRPGNRRFILDSNGSQSLDAGDLQAGFGQSTDLPLAGDWNGDGADEIGVWRPGNRRFILDSNGSFVRDKGDKAVTFGLSGDRPLVGDWSGDGIDNIGVWRPSSRQFILDANNSFKQDGGDIVSQRFGADNDMPVKGRW